MQPTKLPFGMIAALAGLSLAPRAQAAVDPNFYVFLAFGQSNMEGQNKNYAGQDQVALARFQNLSAVACSGRPLGTWVAAVAPIVRCDTKLSPLDYFGRTLVDSLPASIKVGVVPVAVAGSKIEGFDESTYKAYYSAQASWMTNIVSQYGGDPYARLLAMAKVAQQSGVIKGILLHQGESNTGDSQWANKVKTIYNNLLKDLGLEASKVPLLAGEVAPTGVSSGANSMIDALPKTIPTAYVISSNGLTIDNADGQNVHFDAASYRTLGKRYGQQMYKLLKPTLAVAPRLAQPSADADYAVYDVRGNKVSTFHALDATALDNQWSGLQKRLPQGIYWIRNTQTASAFKVLAGR